MLGRQFIRGCESHCFILIYRAATGQAVVARLQAELKLDKGSHKTALKHDFGNQKAIQQVATKSTDPANCQPGIGK